MRSLEQRLDEIRQRSRELIIKRKRRRAVAGVVCAWAVCLGVGALLFFKQPLPDPSTPDVLLEESTDSSLSLELTEVPTYDYSLSNPVKTLLVTDVGHSRTYSDPRQLSELSLLLDTITSGESDCENSSTVTDISGGCLADDAGDMMEEGEYATQEQAGCQLLLTMEDGSTRLYTLEGDVLTRCETNQSYPLTPRELTQLNQLIHWD